MQNTLLLDFSSIFFLQICCMKCWKFSCCIFLQFWRNVLRTSWKHHRKTPVGWCPWDVPRKIHTKIFLLHYFQSYFAKSVSETLKKLAVAYFYIVGEKSRGRPINALKWCPEWRTRSVPRTPNLSIFCKRHFCNNIYNFRSTNYVH